MEFTKKQIQDIAEGIVKSNRDYPLKPKVAKCGTCQKFTPGTDGKVRCQAYPDGVPMKYLQEKEDCKEYSTE